MSRDVQLNYSPWRSVSVGQVKIIASCTKIQRILQVGVVVKYDVVTILRYYPRCKVIHFCRGLSEVELDEEVNQ